MAPQYLAATLRRIERAGGGLATASVARMDEVLPWFRELPADQRAWVMLVAAAGGGAGGPRVAAAVGRSPGGEAAAVGRTVSRAARRLGVEVLGGVHGDRLVVVLGGAADPLAATEKLLVGFGDGPVVVGPAVPSLDEATESARAALAGYRAAPAWPAAPRPVAAADLLPERALAAHADARRMLRQGGGPE